MRASRERLRRLRVTMHDRAELLVSDIIQCHPGVKEAKDRLIAAIQEQLIEAYLEGYES